MDLRHSKSADAQSEINRNCEIEAQIIRKVFGIFFIDSICSVAELMKSFIIIIEVRQT